MIDKTIFRKFDIRGKYPASLNEDAAYKIGLAYANVFPEIKSVVISGDIKKSSPALKSALAKGLNDGGVEVTDIGIQTTPVLNFSICYYGFDGGIQITGSHLPGAYNGIKMQLKDAYPVQTDAYEKMLQLILEDKLDKSKAIESIKKIDPIDRYTNYMLYKFKLKKPLKILIDSGNGTARLLPEQIFRSLGCTVHTLYPEPDDSFPHHVPDPYESKNLQELRNIVVHEGYDLGIAFDGDGDRTGIIDNEGNLVTGDLLLIIFARDALKRKKGPIVCGSRASLALIEDVKAHGSEVIMTIGHHKAVLDKIIETDASFGGETTGHIYFPLEHYKTDDALFAALKLAEIASGMEDFSEFVKSLPRYPKTEEIFIEFSDTEKYQTVQRFVELVKKKGFDVNDVDGARLNFENGWGIVRAANTSPFIKCKFEGRTIADLKEIVERIEPLMRECGIIIPSEQLDEIRKL